MRREFGFTLEEVAEMTPTQIMSYIGYDREQQERKDRLQNEAFGRMIQMKKQQLGKSELSMSDLMKP